mgnify:CR=1 FL=1
MNIHQFQYILAVVDLKNFEAAAEKCFVTQSTLSTMIGKFEEEIGIQIFNRKTKPVSLTDEGRQIVERLRILVKEIDTLKSLIQELKNEAEGELKIAIIPTLAPYLLPLFLGKFTSTFPKLKLILSELTTSEIIASLKSRTLDIGILATPLHETDLLEHKLFDEPFLVYDWSSHKRKKTIRAEELDYKRLWLMEEGHCLNTQVKRICDLSHQKSNRTLNIEFKAASVESLLHFTKANAGLTIIPYLASLTLTREDHDRLIPFANPVPTRRISLVTHQYFVKKKLVQQLQQMIEASVVPIFPKAQQTKVIKPL